MTLSLSPQFYVSLLTFSLSPCPSSLPHSLPSLTSVPHVLVTVVAVAEAHPGTHSRSPVATLVPGMGCTHANHHSGVQTWCLKITEKILTTGQRKSELIYQ